MIDDADVRTAEVPVTPVTVFTDVYLPCRVGELVDLLHWSK